MFRRLFCTFPPLRQGALGVIKSKPNVSNTLALGHRLRGVPELDEKRVLPKLKTFFSANPLHEQNMRELEALWRRYGASAPEMDRSERIRHTRWLTMEEYRLTGCGTRLRAVQYRRLIEMLEKMDKVDHQLVGAEFVAALEKFRRPVNISGSGKTKRQLDSQGRAIAMGGRKTSSARVQMARGSGKILVNGESLAHMFPRLSDRNKIMYPLKVVGAEGKYNIAAYCTGGGVSGQAGALAHGIANALVIFNPLLKTRLRRAGCITRDRRTVERKKPGKVKLRKSPTWVKR